MYISIHTLNIGVHKRSSRAVPCPANLMDTHPCLHAYMHTICMGVHKLLSRAASCSAHFMDITCIHTYMRAYNRYGIS